MLPLNHIRILDLTRMVAGPYCTMMLGDLGAEVIKIEKPGLGDDTRKWGPPFINGESAYFMCINRNKKSLTLELSRPEGQEIFRGLVRNSQVVIENFKTGTMDKFGLGYQQLKDIKPDLIYCSITGFGLSGPYRNKAGTDPILQAVGGFMALNGEPEGKPLRAPLPLVDLSSGLFAHGAIMAALIDHFHTGNGHFVEISLLDNLLSLLINLASSYLMGGEIPQRWGNNHPTIVPFGSFSAKDGDLFLSASADVRWRRLCEALELEHLIDDPQFSTTATRIENRKKVESILEKQLRSKPVDEWIRLLDDVGVPAARINTLDRVFADPHVRGRGLITEVIHPVTGHLPMVGLPVQYDGEREAVRLPPPRLGEHNKKVLREVLGTKDGEINRYKEEGVI